MTRRLLASLLALCMALALLPGMAWAAEELPTSGNCGPNVTWRLEETATDENGVTTAATLTISGTGRMEKGNLDLALHHGYPHYDLTVIIEDGVTTICDEAFGSRYADSFHNYVVAVSIPDSVTSIGAYAFGWQEKLTEVKLPQNLKTIGDSAFSGTALSSISIPASVIRIEDLFIGCTNLTEINVATTNKEYSSQDGMLYNKEKTQLICCPEGKTSCAIPSSVIVIGDSAFYGCTNLAEISIPKSVTTISNWAFYGTNMAEITIPDSVTYIGYHVFEDCTKLKNVVIPDSVTSMGNTAFDGCSSLESITLSGSQERYHYIYFSGCDNLTTVTVNEGVTSLAYTFSGLSNLTTVYLPASLKTINTNTFANCLNLKTIVYAGTEEQWSTITIAPGNPEISLANIVFTGTSQPDTPDKPDKPDTPDKPTTPGRLPATTTTGGLGGKVTVQVTGGHWLTVQVRRAGSIAIMSVQAPGSGTVSMTFSASTGSMVQVWETEKEMVFSNGVPTNPILATNALQL